MFSLMSHLSTDIIEIMAQDIIISTPLSYHVDHHLHCREISTEYVIDEIHNRIGNQTLDDNIIKFIESNIRSYQSVHKIKPRSAVITDFKFVSNCRKPELVKYYAPQFEDFLDRKVLLDTSGRVTSEEKVLELCSKRKVETNSSNPSTPEAQETTSAGKPAKSSVSKNSLQADCNSLLRYAKKCSKGRMIIRGLKSVSNLAEKKKILIARLHDAGYSWKGEVPNDQEVFADW